MRSVNLWPQSYSPKNFKESTIASNSFWKLGYFSCAGLNFREWNPQGRIDSSSPWPIHDPSPISLASHTRYFGASEKRYQGLRICRVFTSSLMFSSALAWVSVHLQGAFLPCSSYRVLDQETNSGQDLIRNMTTPSIPRSSRRLLGTLKSNTFLRFLGSICNPSGVNICPKISRRLVKN